MINRLIFRWTTWQTPWTQSQRNLQLSKATWYLLWQLHIALSWSQTKSWSFIFTRLSRDQALWWKEITGNPSLGLEVLEAETRCTNPAHFGPLGKYLPIVTLIYQSQVARPAPMSAQMLTPNTLCVWEVGEEEWVDKRCGEEPASDACPELWLALLGSGLVFERFYCCCCLVPKRLPF